MNRFEKRNGVKVINLKVILVFQSQEEKRVSLNISEKVIFIIVKLMFLWENFNLVFEEIDIFDKKVVTTMIQIENLEII